MGGRENRVDSNSHRLQKKEENATRPDFYCNRSRAQMQASIYFGLDVVVDIEGCQQLASSRGFPSTNTTTYTKASSSAAWDRTRK
jgi:hypothetical protein